MSSSKVWFVTGVSSGFGRTLTELALKSGDKVAATLRKPEAISDLASKYSADVLLPIQLDVTKHEQVKAAFDRALTHFGRIDIVFNNAGVDVMSEVETMVEADARAMFEVNFWGAAFVTQEALHVFREENKPQGGRLLQVSSGGGVVGLPGNGFYAATKHALEGLSESVAKEIDPAWNIKITLLEFGVFRTQIIGDNAKILPHHPAYDNESLAGYQFHKHVMSPNVRGDAEKAMSQVLRLSRLEDPPMRLMLGNDVSPIIRDKLRVFGGELDKYESWSADLDVDE
ncbi:NAD(P)-binding protein [Coniophora puteana RWD-64-598 SS2]|uniref:NAD(P)-binding protein n=1 Tax=Coniophora puteana (strain RWD-64-598) TaxID=741705 RepID=A0A5M3N0G9_CONPW|nr:NAD(P)-binding protein [Coniophora puteana RWD-64-598 SS2]EIW84534.1 NAD(P)-binding protein [Coniophora puteana RWD-64-598 SS2]